MTSVTKTDEIFQKSAETRIAIKHGRIGAEFTQIVIMRNCLDLSNVEQNYFLAQGHHNLVMSSSK